MDQFTYCTKVCGAKCCTGANGVTCPHVQDDKSCGIYEARFSEEQPDVQLVALVQIADKEKKLKILEIHCTRIEKLIAENKLPATLIAQCCIANPHLLGE